MGRVTFKLEEGRKLTRRPASRQDVSRWRLLSCCRLVFDVDDHVDVQIDLA